MIEVMINIGNNNNNDKLIPFQCWLARRFSCILPLPPCPCHKAGHEQPTIQVPCHPLNMPMCQHNNMPTHYKGALLYFSQKSCFIQDDLPAWPLQGQQPDELLQAGGKGLALRHPPHQPEDHGRGELRISKRFVQISDLVSFQTADFIFLWFVWCFQPPKSSTGNGANPSDKVALVLHRQVLKPKYQFQIIQTQGWALGVFSLVCFLEPKLCRALRHVTDLWVWPALPMEARSQWMSSSQSFSGDF